MLNDTPPRDSRVLHPFAFGLFPLFSLLSVNMVWAGLDEVILPAAFALALAAILWGGLRFVLPDPHRRGLALSLFWVPFYGYSTVVDLFRAASGFRDMLGPSVVLGLLALAAFVGVLALWWLRSARLPFEKATPVLNRIALLMLAVSVTTCLFHAARNPAPAQESASKPPAAPADPSLPNIYFILCDAYPRADYLQSWFGFDNTPFLGGLRDRGFYVAERSRSNYPNTLPSLASMFNMDYLDNALAPKGWDEHYPELFGKIRNSVVFDTLKSKGYEFVAIASGLFPTEMDQADRFIRPGGRPWTEYQQHVIDLTPIRSILNRLKKERWHHRAPFVLQTLQEVRRESDRPMFVFGHVLAPHLPHSYDAEGNVLEHFPPYREGWVQVTQFLNRRLLEVVDDIQREEPNSIILLGSDHGPNTSWQNALTMEKLPWTGTWEEYIKDRTANLCTVYFPDRNYEGLLYPEITPVNLFRAVFNKYLGTDYTRLEDVTYLSPQNSTEIVKVTEVY